MASINGTEETVRLLNVDTPETKKPNVPVQCLGPEATAYLRKRLPAGASVHLEYDVERTDRYERTLAGVFLDGDFINADIARTGHGVAVLFEPNHRFYREVLQAQSEAASQQTGLFNPAAECTIPGQVDAALEGLSGLPTRAPSTAAEASGLLAGAATAIAAGEAAKGLLSTTDDASNGVTSTVKAALAATLTPKLAAAMNKGKNQRSALKRQREDLEAKERNVAASAKAKAAAAQRKIVAETRAKAEAATSAAAERRADARRVAAARATRERRAQQEIRQKATRRATAAQEAREAVRRQTARSTGPKIPTKQIPRKSSNPYPGYTGPRCYAPGGKSWKPCP